MFESSLFYIIRNKLVEWFFQSILSQKIDKCKFMILSILRYICIFFVRRFLEIQGIIRSKYSRHSRFTHSSILNIISVSHYAFSSLFLASTSFLVIIIDQDINHVEMPRPKSSSSFNELPHVRMVTKKKKNRREKRGNFADRNHTRKKERNVERERGVSFLVPARFIIDLS